MEEKPKEMPDLPQGLSRRAFITGAAGTAGLAAVLGVAGCSAGSGGGDEEAAATSWRTPPAEIPADEISETIETDVVVVGSGTAGTCAAFGAQEAGAEVVILEKGETYRAGGAAWNVLNTGLLAEAGYVMTPEMIDEAIKDDFIEGGGRAREYLKRQWAYNGHIFFDKLVKLLADAGRPKPQLPGFPRPSFDLKKKLVYPELTYPTFHWMDPDDDNRPILETLHAHMDKVGGVKRYYSTPAEQLVKSNERVTGVIAKKKDGSYLQVNARKGVVLATGDYGGDQRMVKELIPGVEGLQDQYSPVGINTGDGHKMGLWAGGAFQQSTHGAAVVALSVVQAPEFPVSLLSQPNPFLVVNKNGERFHNEGTSWFMAGHQILSQPGKTAYQVFDSTWADAVNEMAIPTVPYGIVTIDAAKKEAVEKGSKSANTLEELAKAIEVPADKLKEAVDRRNALADAGHDDDFGVPIDWMKLTKITTPPFYACQIILFYIITLGGLLVSKDLQVIDDNGIGIPGLYAAGNTIGELFGVQYGQALGGISNGCASTFGYLAGQHVATS
ncbi:MAG: FAD-dependent oxidoreductase [Coriobacteriia bacterium]